MPLVAPEVSRETAAPLQESGRGWRAPVGKVRDPGKLQPESSGKRGVGSHKPPRVKVILMNGRAWGPLISTTLLPHDLKKTQLQLLLDYMLCPWWEVLYSAASPSTLSALSLSKATAWEPCGWRALGAPARHQGCASEVGEPTSEHWSTRDLPAPCNTKRRKSLRDLHLNIKTQLHSTTSKLQCWTPYAKQLARQEHSPIH